MPAALLLLSAETVCHIWLLPRLSAISCFLHRLLCLVNSFLLPRVLAGSRITWTVSAGSHFSWTVVSAGSRRSWQSRWMPNMTDRLCRKQKLADSFILCDLELRRPLFAWCCSYSLVLCIYTNSTVAVLHIAPRKLLSILDKIFHRALDKREYLVLIRDNFVNSA